MNRIKQSICNFSYRTIRKLHLVKYVPDTTYLKLRYYCNFGKSLKLDNPRTYNEKCQWMKLNYHNPLFTTLADKYEVKKYVENILGPGYTFPLLGVWDKPEDIDFDRLPNEFIQKCNHNSVFGMTICKDKEKNIYCKAHGKDNEEFGREEAIEWIKRGIREDYYYAGREWPYKNIKRKIIAEKLMKSDDGEPLKDYKFFCFDGAPKYVWVGSNYHPTWFNVMSADWKNQHVLWGYVAGPEILPPPPQLEEMRDIARKLSKGIPHVRVDLYSIGGKIYFGEYTFYTHAGLCLIEPEEWNEKLGSLIKLPEPMR